MNSIAHLANSVVTLLSQIPTSVSTALAFFAGANLFNQAIAVPRVPRRVDATGHHQQTFTTFEEFTDQMKQLNSIVKEGQTQGLWSKLREIVHNLDPHAHDTKADDLVFTFLTNTTQYISETHEISTEQAWQQVFIKPLETEPSYQLPILNTDEPLFRAAKQYGLQAIEDFFMSLPSDGKMRIFLTDYQKGVEADPGDTFTTLILEFEQKLPNLKTPKEFHDSLFPILWHNFPHLSHHHNGDSELIVQHLETFLNQYSSPNDKRAKFLEILDGNQDHFITLKNWGLNSLSDLLKKLGFEFTRFDLLTLKVLKQQAELMQRNTQEP